MGKIVTKDVVIRRIIGFGVFAAISVAVVVIGNTKPKFPDWAGFTFLGSAFLTVCYFIGIFVAWGKIANQNFLKENNFNVDLELEGDILVDKRQRKFCVRGNPGSPWKFLSWDKIKAWQLEWETKNNWTNYFVRFDVDDFHCPTIRHKLDGGPGFGPQEMAQKTIAQIGMLIKGEA